MLSPEANREQGKQLLHLKCCSNSFEEIEYENLSRPASVLGSERTGKLIEH